MAGTNEATISVGSKDVYFGGFIVNLVPLNVDKCNVMSIYIGNILFFVHHHKHKCYSSTKYKSVKQF